MKTGKAAAFLTALIMINACGTADVSAETRYGGRISPDTSRSEEPWKSDEYGKFYTVLDTVALTPHDTIPVYDSDTMKSTWGYTMTSKDKKILQDFIDTHLTDEMTVSEKVSYTSLWLYWNIEYAGLYEEYSKLSESPAECGFSQKSGQCLQYNGALAYMMAYMGFDSRILFMKKNRYGYQHFTCEVVVNGSVYEMEVGNYGGENREHYMPHGFLELKSQGSTESITAPLPGLTSGKWLKAVNSAKKTLPEIFDSETVTLPGNAVIKTEKTDSMGFEGRAEYTYRLSDFSAENQNFEYAAFGLTLPDGYAVESILPASADNSAVQNNARASETEVSASGMKIHYAAPDSDEAAALDRQAGRESSGGYVVLTGVDTGKMNSDAELFTVTFSAPASGKLTADKMSVASMFGRYTDLTSVSDDGTVLPHVAFIVNSDGEKIYSENEVNCFSGLRGDVNLDGRVSQADATAVLREVLSQSVSERSVLHEFIRTDTAGESSESLARFLGDVDLSSSGKKLTQNDATLILKAVLARDVAGEETITDEMWRKIIR